VKARASDRFGHPYETIVSRKRRAIERAADGWISAHGQDDETYRFDAVAVRGREGSARVEHLPDAWRP
jgi:putative endonuclease